MSNLTKLEFIALDISNNNYLAWTLDVEIHLDAMNLGETIKEENATSLQDRSKTMIFLRHHLHEKLKIEYLTVKDLYLAMILIHLRLQDFKSVSEYNSTMFKKYFELIYFLSFKKYFELISCLLVVEQNNELLMKNHQSRPTGSKSFPEVNAAIINNFGHSRYRESGRGRGHSRGRGRGHGEVIIIKKNSNFKRTVPHYQKWENNGNYHRCGKKGH
ncbi:hypothetical protein Pfo_000462 [Paulownia fortunei]|nr:hypothetical protein Pfo_000462 [Paulownia fortunei]